MAMDEFEILVWIGRVVGLSQLGYDSRRRSCWSKVIIILVAILVAINGMYSFLFTDEKFISIMAPSIITRFALFVNRLSLYSQLGYTVLAANFYGHRFASYIESMNSTARYLKNLALESGLQLANVFAVDKYRVCVVLVCELWYLIVMVTFHASLFWEHFDAPSLQWLQFTLQNITFLSTIEMGKLYMLFSAVRLTAQLRSYRQILSHVICNSEAVKMDKIADRLSVAYRQLWDRFADSQALLSFFALFVPVNLIVMLATEGLLLFELLLCPKDRAIGFTVNHMVCTGNLMLWLLLLCTVYEWPNSEKEAISRLLRRADLTATSGKAASGSDCMDKLAVSIQKWDVEPMYLSACGFFYINKALLVSIVGVSLTYGIIFIQVDVSKH